MSDRWIIGVAAGGGAAALVLLYATFNKLLKKQIVWEYQKAILYKKGVFSNLLAAGSYWLWTPSDSVVVVDSRRTTTTLSGQEIVTADNVGVKLSILITYQVVDPVKAINHSQGWYQEIYAFTQLAARDVLSAMKVEELLEARASLGDQLLELVKPKAAEVGVEMLMVQVKDVVLPAEIRKIFGDVLRAQKEGLAALERARGEQAALRTLANAARVLDGNPALMSLRILQALSGQGGNAPPTVVLNVTGGLPPFPPPPHPSGHQGPPPHHAPPHQEPTDPDLASQG